MAHVKICVMGDGGVGKTASTIQYVASHFVEMYDPTIEDSYRRQILLDDQHYLVELLDTAGQDDFSPLRDSWIRESEGFLLVYSITDRNSLDYLDDVLKQIVRTKEDSFMQDPVPIILAGNKSDLEERREVSLGEVKAWAQARGVKHVSEFSAKTRQNLAGTFEQMVRLIAEKQGSSGKTSKSKKNAAKACNIL